MSMKLAIEVVAVVFSLISVWYAVKNNKLTWPTGILGIAAYMWLFIRPDVKLYADFGLQIIFLIQSVYGWLFWKGKHHVEPPMTALRTAGWIWTIAGVVGLTIPCALLLKTQTDAAAPWFDSFCSVTSLIANWLLAKKKIENWHLWILADAVYVGLFLYKGLILSAGLYALFFYMSIVGLVQWRKTLANESRLSIWQVLAGT